MRLTILLGILACWIISLPVHAQTSNEDVRILIDVSGSMKKSDPENLRVSALNLLINLLPEGASAGAWAFGTDAKPLVKLGRVDKNWKKNGLLATKRIGSKDAYTDIGLGLEAATRGWQNAVDETRRSVILLTDGMVDISKSAEINKEARTKISDETLIELAKKGAKVHTIALSSNADAALLKSIATKTDGFFATAHTSEDLLKIFLQAFDQSIEQEQVPIHDNMFEIDSGVDEFTALIFRVPGSNNSRVKSPSGQVFNKDSNISNVKWYSDDSFDLITVKDPDPGTWHLLAKVDPDNRVTIVSDLSVRIDGLRNNVLQGDKLDLSLYMEQEGELVDRAEFLSLLDVAFKQSYLDTGKVWEGKLTSHTSGTVRVPKDGRFKAKLGKTLLPGVHEFGVEIDGKTFVRRKTKRMTVHAEVLDVVTVAEDGPAGAAAYFLNAVPVRGLVDTQTLSVSARVTLPNEAVEKLFVEKTPFGSYKVLVPAKAGEGTYEVMFKVAGKSMLDTEFNILQGPYQINYGAPTKPHLKANSVLDPIQEIKAPQTPEAEKPKGKESGQAETKPLETADTEKPAADSKMPSPKSVEQGQTSQLSDTKVMQDQPKPAQTAGLDEAAKALDPSEQKAGESWFSNRWLMIVVAVLANLFIALIVYVLYRKISLRKESKDVATDSELISALEAAETDLSDDSDEQADAVKKTNEKDEAQSDQQENALGDMLDDLDDVFAEDDDDDKN